MPDLDKVVIHIGMPKTGSTAIQNAFDANRDVLATLRIRYPRTATRGTAHHPLAWSAALKRRPRDDVPPLRHLLEDLAHELRSSTGIVVLSSEALFHLPSQEFRSIVQWSERAADSLTVVAYLRPPAAFHEGWYRQLVKTTAYDLTFGQHLQKAPIIDVPSRFRTVENLVGRSRLLVRPYLRDTFLGGDVVQDFCAAIGIDASKLAKPAQPDSNPSLDTELVEFKVRLHQAGLGHSPRLANALLDWSSSRSHSTRSLFTHDSWHEFIDATEPDHLAVVEHYGLPSRLRDHKPQHFTSSTLSDARFTELLYEFKSRYPVVSRDDLRTVSAQALK